MRHRPIRQLSERAAGTDPAPRRRDLRDTTHDARVASPQFPGWLLDLSGPGSETESDACGGLMDHEGRSLSCCRQPPLAFRKKRLGYLRHLRIQRRRRTGNFSSASKISVATSRVATRRRSHRLPGCNLVRKKTGTRRGFGLMPEFEDDFCHLFFFFSGSSIMR